MMNPYQGTPPSSGSVSRARKPLRQSPYKQLALTLLATGALAIALFAGLGFFDADGGSGDQDKKTPALPENLCAVLDLSTTSVPDPEMRHSLSYRRDSASCDLGTSEDSSVADYSSLSVNVERSDLNLPDPERSAHEWHEKVCGEWREDSDLEEVGKQQLVGLGQEACGYAEEYTPGSWSVQVSTARGIDRFDASYSSLEKPRAKVIDVAVDATRRAMDRIDTPR